MGVFSTRPALPGDEWAAIPGEPLDPEENPARRLADAPAIDPLEVGLADDATASVSISLDAFVTPDSDDTATA